MNYEQRQTRTLAAAADLGHDCVYVTNLTNVRYLCGFTGSSGSLLLADQGRWFFTDGRYRTQSAEEVTGAEIEIYATPGRPRDAIQKGAAALGVTRVAFEEAHVSAKAARELPEIFEGYAIAPVTGLVEELRRSKDSAELEMIRVAAELADAGFAHILEHVAAGKSEREIALELEFFMRGEGADAVAFELIVAGGERSALPHARPTPRAVEKGGFLLFDLGCVYGGYCSDLTRTVVVGPLDDRHRETYELVHKANEAGLSALGAGTAARDADAAARDVIAKEGLDAAFPHGLGHGVGMEVHESPTIRSTSEDILATGDVVTVEPGVYFAGWGGVRIEDLVAVGHEGIEVLSKAPKDLVTI